MNKLRKHWKIKLGRFTFRENDAPYYVAYKTFWKWKYVLIIDSKKRRGFKSIQEATQWISTRNPNAIIECDDTIFEPAKPKSVSRDPMFQTLNGDSGERGCLHCGTPWGNPEEHAKICLLGEAELNHDKPNEITNLEVTASKWSGDLTLFKAAYAEAIKRYPESVRGLVWFSTAIGMHTVEPSPEHLAWALDVIRVKNLA